MTNAKSNAVQSWTLLDRLPAGLWWRLLAVLVGAALVSMGAQITTPSGGEVPGTFQTLAVLVVGALLGPVFGTASVALYVLLGSLGAPIFADGGSGFGGPTSGYFIGFIIAALVVGLVSRRACALPPNRAVPRLLIAMLLGLVAIYLLGLAWLVIRAGLSVGESLSVGFAPFIVGDFLEATFAAAVTAVVAARLRLRS